MSLLQYLLEEHILICPTDRTPLFEDNNGHILDRHGQIYSVENGAIDLFMNYEGPESSIQPPRSFLVEIAKSLGLRYEDDCIIGKISKAVQATSLIPKGSEDLQAEIRELASRMNIREPEDWIINAETKRERDCENLKTNEHVKITFLRHYISGQMLAGSQQFFSFRIINEGSSILSSRVAPPVFLSYHWANKQGEVVEFEGKRSVLPRNLMPGEEITVMVEVITPTEPGEFVLQVRSIQESVQWHEDSGLNIPIEIVTSIEQLSAQIQCNDEPFNYESDIQAIKELLVDVFPLKHYGFWHHLLKIADQICSKAASIAIAKKILAKIRSLKYRNSRYYLLEIAGGVYPQGMFLTADRAALLSVDISFAQCQLGSIIFDQEEALKDHFQFIAADAYRLPIAPRSIDGIIICAALHHFPDPIRLLRNLHPILKRNGKLVIVREPCAPNPYDVQYLRDINLGINEQQWNLQEYAHIFEQSNFVPEFALVRSQCSLMTVLRPAKLPPERDISPLQI